MAYSNFLSPNIWPHWNKNVFASIETTSSAFFEWNFRISFFSRNEIHMNFLFAKYFWTFFHFLQYSFSAVPNYLLFGHILFNRGSIIFFYCSFMSMFFRLPLDLQSMSCSLMISFIPFSFALYSSSLRFRMDQFLASLLSQSFSNTFFNVFLPLILTSSFLFQFFPSFLCISFLPKTPFFNFNILAGIHQPLIEADYGKLM